MDSILLFLPPACNLSVNTPVLCFCISQASAGNRSDNEMTFTVLPDAADGIKKPLAHSTGGIMVLAQISFPVLPHGRGAFFYLCKPSRFLCIFQHLIGCLCLPGFRQNRKKEGRGEKAGSHTVTVLFHCPDELLLRILLLFFVFLSVQKAEGERTDQFCLPVCVKRSRLHKQSVISLFGSVCIFSALFGK